jgi:hypothetical protein
VKKHVACLTLIVAVCVSVPFRAQTTPTKAKPAPRTADGKPDLSGVWIGTGPLRLMAGEAEVAAARQADIDEGRPAPRTEPPPYKPEYEKKRQYYLDRRGIDDPMARCLISGVPRISFRPLPFQIFQMPNQMVFIYETHHAFRIIPTDGRPHPDDIEPSYLGESVARWEGDTLVVDVTGFNDKTWLIGVGTVHSEKLQHDAISGHHGRSRSVHQTVERRGNIPAAAGRTHPRIRVHREQRGFASNREAAEGRVRFSAAPERVTKRIRHTEAQRQRGSLVVSVPHCFCVS